VTAIDWAQMQRLRLLLLALFAYRTWDDGGPECNPGVETSDFLVPKDIGKKHISANLSIFLGLLLVSIDLYCHQLHSITLQSITIPLPFCCHTLPYIAIE